jgi:hypothetical protein
VTDRIVKKIYEMVEQSGSTVDRVERGKHFKFYITTPTGKQILTVSVSSSDGRSEQNNRGLLRRWART